MELAAEAVELASEGLEAEELAEELAAEAVELASEGLELRSWRLKLRS